MEKSLNLLKIRAMGIPELRREIHDYINLADERFLKMVHALSKEYGAPAVVGYNNDGTPITADQLRKRVKAASGRVKSGEYIRQEDIEGEVENW